MNTLRKYLDIISESTLLENPWEGQDPAKAQAWASLSPEDQKWLGGADPTDQFILARAPNKGKPASTSAAAPAPAPSPAPTPTADAVAASGQPNDATGVDAAVAAQAAQPAQSAQPAAPTNRDSMTFGQAFKDARNKKEPKFTWKGKEYTTQLTPSGDSATAQGITNAPAGAKDKVSLPNPGTKAIQHYLNTKYGQNLTVDGKDGPQTSAAIRSLSNKVSTDEYANIAGLAYAYNVLPGQGTGTVSLGNPEFTKRMAALGYDPKTGNPVSGGKSSAGTGQGTPAQAGMTAPAAQEPANASELRTKRDAYGKAYVAMKNNPATSPQALAQMEKNLTDIGAQMKAAGISESQTIGYAEDQNLVSIIHLAGLR